MKRNLIFGLVSLFFLPLYSQEKDYSFARKVQKVRSAGYHWIPLSKPILAKLNDDVSDIRLMQITEKDTAEIPYLLDIQTEKNEVKTFPFKQVNESYNDKSAFATFKLEKEGSINQIHLELSPDNFDVLATVEGSNNRLKYVTIKEDIRLVGIANARVNYQFNTLTFPESEYKYFRVKFNHPDVKVESATLFREINTPGKYQLYELENWETRNDTEKKNTEIIVFLKDRAPISRIQLRVNNNKDYYRPVSVDYLKQKIESPNGEKEIWRSWVNGVLNSREEQDLRAERVFTDRLRLSINNFDDLPLQIEAVQVSGPAFGVIADIKPENNYLLMYGNPAASAPRYDLVHFKQNLPNDPIGASLGEEEVLIEPKITDSTDGPTSMESYGLWAIILLVIVVLGGITFRMMKKAQN